MRVLIVGSGGREHALARRLQQSASVSSVWAIPGHDAMARDGVTCLPGSPTDAAAVLDAARAAQADLIVVGPEAPLVAGVADALRAAGFAVFGPGREGARLEGSKAWAKAFMQRHGIPTARAATFRDFAQAEAHIRRLPLPPVVKVDGLAAGKGVTVARTHDEALAAARAALVEGAFGAAGRSIVIEERLEGVELSVLAVLDGQSYRLLPAAQDHKTLLEGGRGPNTGGMGAYSPVPFASDEQLSLIEQRVFAPALAGLRAEGIDYRGVLYAGLMLTATGPYVLEFNCRFGDPEAQAVLPRLRGDFGRLLWAAATGTLAGQPIDVRPEAAVCVILASRGYPGRYETGHPIEGLERLAGLSDVFVDHAGTRLDGGTWRTAGGRVLGITALGRDLTSARQRAYAACACVRFSGMHYRRDIAAPPSQPPSGTR
ncbi:MAG TPA: phosphoribosylamine--glycine ligase [Bacillota bacterium]